MENTIHLGFLLVVATDCVLGRHINTRSSPTDCVASSECPRHHYCESEFRSCFSCWDICVADNEAFCKPRCPETWASVFSAPTPVPTPTPADIVAEGTSVTNGGRDHVGTLTSLLAALLVACVCVAGVITVFIWRRYLGKPDTRPSQRTRHISYNRDLTDNGALLMSPDNSPPAMELTVFQVTARRQGDVSRDSVGVSESDDVNSDGDGGDVTDAPGSQADHAERS